MAPALRFVHDDDEELNKFLVADGCIVTVVMEKLEVSPAAVMEF